MVQRKSKIGSLAVVAGAAVAVKTLVWDVSGPAFADGDAVAELARVARPWEQQHFVTVNHNGLSLSSRSQGGHWGMSLAEEGSNEGLFVTKDEGGDAAYGLLYDSSKSSVNLGKDVGLKRVRATAVSGDGNDVDWTLRLEGDSGRQLSMAGNQENVVYDASLGMEVPVIKGVSAAYAIDAKRRADASSFLPSWIRHALGLRYASPAGDVRLNVATNPDSEAGLDYEAILDGEIDGSKVQGSPHYRLRAAVENGENPAYDAKLNLQGPHGVAGGIRVGLEDGSSTLSGHATWAGRRQIADGIEVAADAKVVASTANDDILELEPVGVSASADLAKLMPALAADGSTMDVRTRYKVGADRPAVNVSGTLNTKLPVSLSGEVALDSDGESSGKLRVSGAAQNLAAKYEAISNGNGVRHVAEAVYPQEMERGSARAFGRLTQSDDDFEGKPRVQLGVQYDVDAGFGGRNFRISGQSAGYDSGNQLINDDGTPWNFAPLGKARNAASTLRKRIEGSTGEGRNWLRK